MSDTHRFQLPHDHQFLSEHHQVHERRTWFVIGLTASMMIVEIVAGMLFGSMALLADGWHMASHASAMGITAGAYYWGRKHQENRRFTFGTGKFGDLAGYSSALLLGLIAIIMAYESVLRFISPVAIHFNEAILVAVIGLIVNVASAFILKEDHHPSAGDGHHDHNLRAAYLHVLADALTSILAIVALTFGKFLGWNFLDPAMGVVSALVISRWSYGLMRDTGGVLLDYNQNDRISGQIKQALADEANTRIEDLHVWRMGPRHYGCIIALKTKGRQRISDIKHRLGGIPDLSHVTIELN
jgi:cation diffusion facilitator family transporter